MPIELTKDTEVPSYPVRIWIAGDYADACRACREYAERGACVTVTPTEYVYTRGSESGVCVGLINYPRFPKTPDVIWDEAYEMALFLMDRLYQDSCSVEAPDKTRWLSRRREG